MTHYDNEVQGRLRDKGNVIPLTTENAFYIDDIDDVGDENVEEDTQELGPEYESPYIDADDAWTPESYNKCVGAKVAVSDGMGRLAGGR